MEAKTIVNSAMRGVAQLVQAHPVYSAVAGSFLGIIPLCQLYSKLTLGKCTSCVDMTGKTVIVTGANSGIGRATAEELAKKGARVILACRSFVRGQKALSEIVSATKNHDVVLKILDLASFVSIRQFVEDILNNEDRIDVLINNAGIIGSNEMEVTIDGCEKVMQSNHLGPFLLTTLLLEKLKSCAPSRIINVSSMLHKYSKLNLETLSKKPYNANDVYNDTKLANMLFTRELSKRLEGTGITVNALHPGVVVTNLPRNSTGLQRLIVKGVFFLVGKTPLEGAQTTLYAAMAPELETVSGKYFADCKEAQPAECALDDDKASRLWAVSQKIVDCASLNPVS